MFYVPAQSTNLVDSNTLEILNFDSFLKKSVVLLKTYLNAFLFYHGSVLDKC